MTFKHGVYTSEPLANIIAPVTADSALPIVVGTAPVNLTDKYIVNEPVLCYTYDEAVTKLGFSNDFDNYTLCESMYSQFVLFGVSPIVFINVLDPKKHKKTTEQKPIKFVNGEAKIEIPGILKKTLKYTAAKTTNSEIIKDDEISIDAEFDEEGYLKLYSDDISEVSVQFDQLDPSLVTDDDIVGGVDKDGNYKGLELINHVFPLFRLVPGTIIAPKYSTSSLVAAVMEAKTQHINGVFSAVSIPDISTVDVTDYTTVAKTKSENNITSPYQFATWPKVKLGDKEFHISSQLASLMGYVDAQNDGIPYVSPSNERLKMDSAVLAGGKPVILGVDQANYLNGQGIVTAINFIGGHVLWGNRTAAYPGNSAAKDAFIPLRRMFNFVSNSLVLTYWQKVDDPGNPKLIETIVRSVNTWLDGLTASGKLLGGRIEFRKESNPELALLNGKYTFKVFLTPPTPAEEIDFELELDVSYFSSLFAA